MSHRNNVGRDDEDRKRSCARRSPAIIAFLGLIIKIGRGGVLLRPSHAYMTNFQSGGAEPLPYKGLCTLEESCELHSLRFLLRRAEVEEFGEFFKDCKQSLSSRPTLLWCDTQPNSNLTDEYYEQFNLPENAIRERC